MSIWESIILGIVQGATEFLPVSSSGHLVLVERWMGLTQDDLVFEVAVHGGTLLAVLLYFRRRIVSVIGGVLGHAESQEAVASARRLAAFLVIGSIPAAIIGLVFKSEIEAAFGAPWLSAVFLIVTGLWLLSIRFARPPSRPVSAGRSWWIGCAQAVSILPGISRSGSTIATGVLLGVPPGEAAEFSFLLSIPAVAGAIVLAIPEAGAVGSFHLADAIGAAVAGVTGFAALSMVFAALRRGRFVWFGVYCISVGITAFFLLR